MKSMSSMANLTLGNQKVLIPTTVGTEDETALDIGKLRAQTGAITLDNGFVNTGSCQSEITFLDGEKGILRYRGYPIEQLAEKSNFLEVSYLLINGKLPTQDELKAFESEVKGLTDLPESIKAMLKTFPASSHPMAILSGLTVALSGSYNELCGPDPSDEEKKKLIGILMSAPKLISALYYRNVEGKDFIPSNPKLSYAANFMNMMFGQDKDGSVDEEVAKALDVLLILHADHEQNCSTSTVRVVGSSKANLFASISGGINALWGPSHGGANQAVLEMLQAISSDGGDYKKFLQMAKDKNNPFRLMGFGHRVYKNFDPRAKIIKKACDTVLTKMGVKDPLLDIAKGLEEEALIDPYFVDRKLYPNVDFYSGIIYRALGIPTNMFTVMFALGRMPGWLAQWKEMVEDSAFKICRPRQIYTGEGSRDYTSLSER